MPATPGLHSGSVLAVELVGLHPTQGLGRAGQAVRGAARGAAAPRRWTMALLLPEAGRNELSGFCHFKV